MGWVEGVVEIIKALAWPIVVLVAVLVLKREIGKLITRLTRFSGAGVEVDFGQQVEQANEIAEAIAPDTPNELPPASRDSDGSALPKVPTLSDLMAEADAHPVGAMVRAWNLIETRVAELTPHHAQTPGNPRKNLMRLVNNEIISLDLYELAQRLAALRNRVVHGDIFPSRTEAKEFVTAAWRLASELSKAEGIPH